MKPKTKQEQERTTSAMCDNVAQRVQRQKLTNHVTQIAHTVVKPTSVYKPPHTHQRTHSRSSRTPRRKTQGTIRKWLPLRFLSKVPYTTRLYKPFCRVAQTFAFGCANLCLRLRKPSPQVAQVSASHRFQKPSPQVAQTFAPVCANLCLRLRKPLPQVARTFASGCANLRLRLRKPSPQVAQSFACVSLVNALLDSEHCVVSQLSCGLRIVVSTHLSLLRSRHPDK